MRRSVIALLSVGLLASSLALPSVASADPSREQVERLLGGYEFVPTPAQIRELGAGADRVLIAIGSDPQVGPLRRIRAFGVLGYVPSIEGERACRQVLKQGAAATGLDAKRVGACAESLGVIGAALGHSVRAALVPLLDHRAVIVRAGAARGLAAAGEVAALPGLRARLVMEQDALVRAQLTAAIDHLSPKK